MGAYTNAARECGASASMARMRRKLSFLSAVVFLVTATVAARSETPAGITSLLGQPLASPALAPEIEAQMKAQLADAIAAWQVDRDDADALIWVGRRTAYLGRYRDAIEIFSDGIARHPADARMYRHRGHRYLTVREIDRAVADFEKAVDLMAGRPDSIEPDGLPNALNIPTGTLHSNVYYHLALGYYLKGDFGRAAETFAKCRNAAGNADNLVAASHWLYLALRRAGREAGAAAVLLPITAHLDVIENGEYHRLLLMYKGEIPPEALLATAGDDSGGSASRYGVSAWYLVNGRRAEAESLWASILDGSDWSAFGYLAAEAEVADLASSSAPPTKSTMIESMPARVLSVTSAVTPTMSGPSTAANFPIML